MYNYFDSKIFDLQQRINQLEIKNILQSQNFLLTQSCCSIENTKNKVNSLINKNYNCIDYSLVNSSLNNFYIYGGIGNQLLWSTEKNRPKKKTLEDLEYELFPDNPIRDYINKELERIKEKYRKIEAALGGL